MSDAPDRPVAAGRQAPSYTLQCMEIVGGNHATERLISSPGLDIWVASRPYKGDAGGDVHYFSMCGSGRVTRLAMADVAGHGPEVDQTAQWLRTLMRKHINLLDQTRLARAINREFPGTRHTGQFATVLFLTYFAPTDHLIVCNAGHPRPIWFSSRLMRWQLLDESTPDTGPSIRESRATYALRPVANLPLGVIEPTDYHQFAVKLDKDDLVLVYTDALTEASDPQGALLGEEGLLRLASELEISGPQEVGRSLLNKVDQWRGHRTPEDDQTLVVLHHNATEPPRMSVSQALKSMARMLGLRNVYNPALPRGGVNCDA
jgi:sigma-B regulation protein RsbU (phosphoserine phosphatase)